MTRLTVYVGGRVSADTNCRSSGMVKRMQRRARRSSQAEMLTRATRVAGK